MRRMVAAGALGRVVSVEGRMVTSSVEQRNKDHWLFSKEVAGGGSCTGWPFTPST